MKSDEQLDAELKQWHQHSREQHPLPDAVRQQLQLTPLHAGKAQPVPSLQLWRKRGTEWLALAACALIIIFWQKPDLLLYQIEQGQMQDGYQVQLHHLVEANSQVATTQSSSTITSTTSISAASPAARRALFSQSYQDYLQASARSVGMRQQVVWREDTDQGWQLRSCDWVLHNIDQDLLLHLRQLQADPKQWQQLAQSRYLLLNIGQQGQIIALGTSQTAPTCS